MNIQMHDFRDSCAGYPREAVFVAAQLTLLSMGWNQMEHFWPE